MWCAYPVFNLWGCSYNDKLSYEHSYSIHILYSHFITYYSHIILYALLFQVLTFRETRTGYCSYCMNDSDVYIHILGKMVNESHPRLSLNCITSYICHCFSLIVIFNYYWLFFNHACEHPIILKIMPAH